MLLNSSIAKRHNSLSSSDNYNGMTASPADEDVSINNGEDVSNISTDGGVFSIPEYAMDDTDFNFD